MAHRLPYPVPWGHGSVGYFADRPADRLIIFVHGFGGNATKTWKGMDALLREPGVQSADVVFYGYGSLAAPARNSAALFHDLLAAAAGLSRRWSRTLGQGGAAATRDYQDILIVAHSLGAAVVRRALLDALGDGSEWVPRCRILLFGPAHMGTRLADLKKMLRSGIGSLLSDLFTFAQVKMPVIDDLERGSDFLVELLEESKAALARGVDRPIRAEGVVFGARDYVVDTKPFCGDPRSDVWAREDHCSVCRTGRTVAEVARHL